MARPCFRSAPPRGRRRAGAELYRDAGSTRAHPGRLRSARTGGGSGDLERAGRRLQPAQPRGS
ncbi:MAG: hypothetical protein C4328_10155, partial [Meiothermus sp.]